jgi:hypothetical protein
MFADYNLASTYELEMAQGRYYYKEFGSDTTAIVLKIAIKDLVLKEILLGSNNTICGNQMLCTTSLVVKIFIMNL